MYCHVIAHTVVAADVLSRLSYRAGEVAHADALAEYAGRTCYQSWEKPSPKTATNAGYLGNIVNHQHLSVMEHASITFAIEGVSRALLAELSRHRHLSLSVESQRYVDQTGRAMVLAPAYQNDPDATAILAEAFVAASNAYIELVEHFTTKGLARKQARQAARMVLPNCQPVSLVVTGNVRALREVITKRHHLAADAEIQELAGLILAGLREIAPNSVADLPEQPYGNEEVRRAA